MTIDVTGARLSALHLRLPDPQGVVFFLHGNNGNLATWFVNADFYRAANYDLFMLDYRGYGKSSGRIESEEQLRADVLAAWRSVAGRYLGKRRVIYAIPYTSIIMLGGMRKPNVPAPAREPKTSERSYFRFSNSGRVIFPTVAVVAAEEPLTAANSVQATIFT